MFLHDFATLSTSIPRYGTEYSPRHSNELCSAENDDTRQRDLYYNSDSAEDSDDLDADDECTWLYVGGIA